MSAAEATVTTYDEGGSFGLCRVEVDGVTVGAAMQWPSSDEWRVSRGEGTDLGDGLSLAAAMADQ